jgi:hypothetical protein
VAEYLIESKRQSDYREKRGQGAKDIGGEIQVTAWNMLSFLKNRGYVVDPDPQRHRFRSLQNVPLNRLRPQQTGIHQLNSRKRCARFYQSIEHLRNWIHRITLKTGSYGMEALAWQSACDRNQTDLLTTTFRAAEQV